MIERDVSLAEAARMLGRGPNTLRGIWREIPTAYVTERGRYYVNPEGLREWLRTRGQQRPAAGQDASSEPAGPAA